MPSFPELLPLLLAPVALLLFMDFLRSRRISYPHDLVERSQRRGKASLFLKSFRSRYDVILDAAAAVLLALAIPATAPVPGGGSGGKPAVVVDCSRSMLAGARGSRPLDLALRRLLEDPGLAGAEAFALAFDPASMRTRLQPLSRIAAAAGKARGEARAAAGIAGKAPPGAASALAASSGTAGADAALEAADGLEYVLPFFAVDYGALADLRRRGYGRVTLLTDELGGPAEGIDVVELGYAVEFAAYPTAARRDEASDSWIAAFAEPGVRGAMTLYSCDERTGQPSLLPEKSYAIEDSSSGRLVRFAESGLYLASFKDPAGGPGAEFALRMGAREAGAAASGRFSERMASVIPFLELSRRPSLALVDSGSPPPPGKPLSLVTTLLPEAGDLLLDPALAAGRPVAAGYAKGSDFALGPSSIANEDLPLAYDAALRELLPAPFAASPPALSRRPIRVGGAYLARTAGGLVPLNAPPGEFFAPRGEPKLSIPPPSPRRWPWALALAALAAAKLAIWLRLSGKRRRAAGAAAR